MEKVYTKKKKKSSKKDPLRITSSARWREKNPLKSKALAVYAAARNRLCIESPGSLISAATLAQWLEIHINDLCKYCGDPATHVDHIVPLSKGGAHNIDNLQMLCKYCNFAKLDRLPEDFEAWLEKIKRK